MSKPTKDNRAVEEPREREERYRRLVEFSPAAMVVHSKGKIVFANQAAINLAGGEKLEDLLEKPMLDFVHPDYHSVVKERIRQTVEESSEVELIPEKFIRLDGRVIDVEVAAIPTTYQEKPATQVLYMDVTERKQAEETLQRQNQELAMLYETSLAISSHLSLELVLHTVAEQMTKALNISECTLSAWRPEKNIVETLVDYSIITPNDTELSGTIYDLAYYPSTRKVLESGEPVLIHRGDPDSDQAEVVLLERLKVHTLLMLPLITGNRVIGLIELIDEVKRRDFKSEEIRLARNLASQAAIAIENARLYEQAQQEILQRKKYEESEREQRHLAEALRDIVAALCSTFNLDEILHLILNNLERVVPHEAANVMLVEEGVARIVARHGYHERRLHEVVVTVRYNVSEVVNLRQMALSGEALVIPDTRKFQGWIETDETNWIRSYIGAPIKIGQENIGFLNLDSDKEGFFTELHADRLKAFADEAAIAIQNSRLYEQVQKQAAILEERVIERTAELQAANERLLALSQVKTDFVANVSHELRTPITSIQLYHALLGSDPVKNKLYIDRLQRETSRLASIIEGLLQLTRLDQEHVKVKISTVDLNQLASSYAFDREPLATSKGLTLVFKKEADLPPVQADSELISQALSVLLTNALNFTPSGGQIVLSTQSSRSQDENWVGIRVSDTGPGIPLDEQTHLFERFFRGKVGHDSRVPGTGLGLAIAKEIVDRHNGRIEVESQGIIGKGTRFTIWLPVVA